MFETSLKYIAHELSPQPPLPHQILPRPPRRTLRPLPIGMPLARKTFFCLNQNLQDSRIFRIGTTTDFSLTDKTLRALSLVVGGWFLVSGGW